MEKATYTQYFLSHSDYTCSTFSLISTTIPTVQEYTHVHDIMCIYTPCTAVCNCQFNIYKFKGALSIKSVFTPNRKIYRGEREHIGGVSNMYYLWETSAVDDPMFCDNCHVHIQASSDIVH